MWTILTTYSEYITYVNPQFYSLHRSICCKANDGNQGWANKLN